VNWLVQFNRGVFMAPWGKSENWTLSVQHTEDDVDRHVQVFRAFAQELTA
jgi:glutamate-1-semialdehyde 2,1-aminomutase